MAEENKDISIINNEYAQTFLQEEGRSNRSGDQTNRIIYYNDEDFINALVGAANDDKLLLFIGSGVSKLCGAPLWKELANQMLDECAADPEYPDFDFQEKNMLLSRVNDEREMISIVQNIMKKPPNNNEAFLLYLD